MKFEFYREDTSTHDRRTHATRHSLGDWRWRLLAKNGRIVAEGGEGYRRSPEMVRTIRNNLMTGSPSSEMSAALLRACGAAGLDAFGRTLKRKVRG